MTSTRTLLLVANWPSDVGYAWWLMESFWVALADYARARGLGVLLAYPEVRELPRAIAAADIDIVERAIRPGDCEPDLLRFLRSRNIAHVYLTDWPSYSRSYVAMRVAGVQSIAVHDHTPGDRPDARGLVRIAKRAIHANRWWSADRYVCVTDFVRERYVNNACVPRERTRVARNGIAPLPHPAPTCVHDLFDIPRGTPVIVMAGRASRYKGIDFALRCMRAVLDRGVGDWWLLVCGDGPDLQEFVKLSRDLGVASRVTFAGRRPDLREFLGSCDIGLQASRGEVGFSLSILEFMSAGLATLVPDRPSTRAATRHAETGWLFPPDDVEATAEAIIHLLADPALRQRLGRAARQEVAEHYRIEQTTSAVVDSVADLFV